MNWAIDMNNAARDKIEFRSEKVREILGTIPNGLVRWGMAIILMVMGKRFLSIYFQSLFSGHGFEQSKSHN